MDIGSMDGWVSAILSGMAVLVGIVLAWIALWQSKRIAEGQALMERESYLSGRMQGLIDHARATVLEARTIQSLTSARTSELLSFPPNDAGSLGERRTAVLSALSRLKVEVELLRVYAVTMPAVENDGDSAKSAVFDLMDEGAWLYSEAFHLSTLAFEVDSADDVDLADEKSIVDALLNGSLVNLSTRLLSDCAGKDYDKIPSFREPGSPWPDVYKRREKMLMDGVISQKSWRPSSLTEAGEWSLEHTVNRFQDRMIEVLKKWDAGRGRR